MLLVAEGHEVFVAYRAHEALTLACRTLPEILFLDIGLPDMDGYEFARRLRALPEMSRSLLVAMTGYGQPKDKDLALTAGFDQYLVKPAKLADVLRLLSKAEC